MLNVHFLVSTSRCTARIAWRSGSPRAGAGPGRDRDVMAGADAGGMRNTTLRGLAAVADLAGLVSGCTGAPSRPGGQASPTHEQASQAQAQAGLQGVGPCPGMPGFSCG